MKLGKNFLLIVLVAAIFAACKNDDDPGIDQTQARINLLAKTWVLSGETGAVTFEENTDVTADYTGFTLTFTAAQDLSTTGGAPVWPSTSKWDFAGTTDNPNLNQIVMSDGVTIDILNISATDLVLKMDYVSASAGSVSNIDGTYTFDLIEQQ